MLFHWGPGGQLRVGHGQQRSELSTSVEPLHCHTERVPLTKDEVRIVELPLRPYGMYWNVSARPQEIYITYRIHSLNIGLPER